MIRWIDLLARVGIAVLFLYAGTMKLQNPGAFAEEIENYRLLSYQLSVVAAYLVLWLEILAAIALFSNPLRLGGWAISALLSAGFTVFVFSAWMRGLDISCGCFGSSSTPVGPSAAARAVVILSITIIGLYGEFRRQALGPRG
jgi:putative oxidoreductase